MRHKKGFEAKCELPAAYWWKWKYGQVWVCDCGNMFKVVPSWTDKGWEFIGTAAKDVEKELA